MNYYSLLIVVVTLFICFPAILIDAVDAEEECLSKFCLYKKKTIIETVFHVANCFVSIYNHH